MLDSDRGFEDPSEVAAIVIEPIQGEGGYHVPSDTFMEEVAAVCGETDIPLVADEIQSGLGRTGEMWAADHFPIEPDVITCAKGLRVGATVSRAEIFPDERARLSSTWGGGDILAAIQGSLTLDAIRDHDLPAHARTRGRAAQERLRDIDAGPIIDVRGKGLMIGVEFDSRERRDAVMRACLQRGLLTMGCGYRTLRLLPPLDVTDREIELGVDRLAAATRAVA